MTEKLRDQLRRQYGEELGDEQYERKIARIERDADGQRKLQLELDGLMAESNARQEDLARLLLPLDQRMRSAHAAWLAACNAREAQRVRNTAELYSLESRIAELRSALNPVPHAERQPKWQDAAWFKEQPRMPERPPMVEQHRGGK